MKIPHIKSTRRSFSFTLVEMVVAMGVLSILTYLLFTVLNETAKVVTLNTGKTKVYTDVRIAMDLLNRDLQQTVDDNYRRCFFASTASGSNRIHFIATIDNNTGNEDAEIGYVYTAASNKLMKCVEFWSYAGVTNANWDSMSNTNTWYNTPTIGYAPNYIHVIDNVRDCQFRFSRDSSNWVTSWDYSANTNLLPAYVYTTITVCDPQDVIRYRGIANVPTNLNRTFTNVVFLPRTL